MFCACVCNIKQQQQKISFMIPSDKNPWYTQCLGGAKLLTSKLKYHNWKYQRYQNFIRKSGCGTNDSISGFFLTLHFLCSLQREVNMFLSMFKNHIQTLALDREDILCQGESTKHRTGIQVAFSSQINHSPSGLWVQCDCPPNRLWVRSSVRNCSPVSM